MAFPKKKSRKITVNNHTYLWIVKEHYINDHDQINLSVMSAEMNGQKLFGQFISNSSKNYIVITPHIIRQTIIYALKNGYTPELKDKDFSLGNLNEKIEFKVSGQQSTSQLIQKFEHLSLAQFMYASVDKDDLVIRQNVEKILENCKIHIANEDWFLGFKIMIENLYKIKFKIDADSLSLIKEILNSEHIDWRNQFYWIDEFKFIRNLFEDSSGVFKQTKKD